LFLVMLLHLGRAVHTQERDWLQPSVWIGPGLLSLLLLAVLIFAIRSVSDQGISGEMVDAKAVGISLFGPYVLAVELASMLLLAGLVVAFHIGREHKPGEVLSNAPVGGEMARRKSEEQA
ncbi:NADH-quinone oxidoreductase subunit J, partial [Escherichia coli]|nr:NADH-quinone oxidoreductase subunit J [Escherichia coli]